MLYAAESADIGLWFWDVVEDKIFSTPRLNDFFEFPAHELLIWIHFLNVFTRTTANGLN